MTIAYEVLGIQDLPDGPGPLGDADRGKGLIWDGVRFAAELPASLAGDGGGRVYVTRGNPVMPTVYAANVRDRGVAGDGVTDDTDALNLIIDSVDDGSALIFPEGIYLISEPLAVPTNKTISLIGINHRSCIIRAASNFAGNGMLTSTYDNSTTKGTGNEIRNLTLDAARYADRCCYFEEGKAWRLNNLYLKDFLSVGMELGKTGVSGAVFYDARIADIDIDGDRDVMTVDRNDSPGTGIYFNTGATDNKITRVSVSYVADIGIHAAAGSNFFTQIHCYDGMDYGMRFDRAGMLSLGYMDSCRLAGIALNSDNVMIHGCKNHYNSESPFSVSTVAGIKTLQAVSGASLVNIFNNLIGTDLDTGSGALTDSTLLGWVANALTVAQNVTVPGYYGS